MNKILTHWFTYAIIMIWLLLCIICQKVDLVSRFANKGIAIIGGEYYRFATSLFLHSNLLHALINASALYFVGKYLEPQITPCKLLIFSMLIGVATESIFSMVFKDAIGIGGSPIIFSLIGLIAALQITKTHTSKFQLGTWYGNWIVGYAFLANIPLFSDSFISTLFMHSISAVLGIALGCLCIRMKLL